MHLIKNITVADTESSYNDATIDLRIVEGVITAIGENLAPNTDAEEVIDLAGAFVAPGFIDIGPYLGDPGHEEREDIASLAMAALRGGYVAVAPLPNTQPVRHDKSGVRFLLEGSRNLPVKMLPLGAISLDTAGTDITEMIDMHQAGAVAFTDGLAPIRSTGLMNRALHYVKSFNGTVINLPLDQSLAPAGQIHEGELSTQLGMTGLSQLSETLVVHRDLELLGYAESRLLLHLISSADSLPLIAAAKTKGLAAFASVGIFNLQFTVDALAGFDANYKVLPPLREATDRAALIEALATGTIDCIASNHVAHQPEAKQLEFPYADFGALALESCFAQALTVLSPDFTPAQIAGFFNHGPRRALGLTPLKIEEGAVASLSFFQTASPWTFTKAHLAGKGHNTPLVGQVLNGNCLGIFQDDQFWSSLPQGQV